MTTKELRVQLSTPAALWVALAVHAVCLADGAGAPEQAQAASPPALSTPTRSTPLSASQTSATPITGPATDTSSAGFTGWAKPTWLSELSIGVKESYDDNVFRVSGIGLAPESSWV